MPDSHVVTPAGAGATPQNKEMWRRHKMKKHLITSLAVLALGASAAFAQKAEFGSADEAKAMLEKAVTAIKADKAKALAAFNAGSDGFKDRDLYPFCANAGDQAMTAHPSPAVKAMKMSEIKDKNNFALGAEMLKVAAEGKISEVAYMWPRPGSEAPVQKVSFVTKVADQVCGVGYYK
jgi:signal transduction histidine kinase